MSTGTKTLKKITSEEINELRRSWKEYYLSVIEFSKLAGVSRQKVYRGIESGELKTAEIDGVKKLKVVCVSNLAFLVENMKIYAEENFDKIDYVDEDGDVIFKSEYLEYLELVTGMSHILQSLRQQALEEQEENQRQEEIEEAENAYYTDFELSRMTLFEIANLIHDKKIDYDRITEFLIDAESLMLEECFHNGAKRWLEEWGETEEEE